MTTHSPFGTPDDPFGADAFDDDSERDQFGRLVTAPSNPVPPMRQSWRKGTLLEDGGESMFRLAKPVGDIGRNLQPDTAKVQGVLERAGFMDLKRTEGPTGLYSFLTEESIRAAQKATGLQIDGLIRPGGETIRMLRAKVGPRPASATQVAQAAPAATPLVPRRKPPQAKIFNPTGGALRNDIEGAGHFGAARGGRRSPRTHSGIDLEVQPGVSVMSPSDGNIMRRGKVYTNDTRFDTIWIDGTGQHKGLKVKMFYVDRSSPGGAVAPSGSVRGGRSVVGAAQDVRIKHGPNMKPHVHMEVYWNGRRINPARILPKLP